MHALVRFLALCAAGVLILAFPSTALFAVCDRAVAVPAGFPDASACADPAAPARSDLSAFPLEQQRIRRAHLTPAFLAVPFLSTQASPSASACPCANASLCAALTVGERPELFAFQVSTSEWQSYDWAALTTVVVTTAVDPALLCYAHAHGVRLVLIADVPAAQLSNSSFRAQWTADAIRSVQATFTDGVNVDFEAPLSAAHAAQYTTLLQRLTALMHAAVRGSQVTADLAWSPQCIDGRCYDARGLAASCDFLFLMSYDLRSQIYDLSDCVASANAPLHRVVQGVVQYVALGIDPWKLVLGVPWYAYSYPCIEGTDSLAERCPIAHVPFQGAPCSDAAGTEIAFVDAVRLLNASSTGRRWNATFDSAWFNHVDARSNRTAQTWMDDLESLRLKYAFAAELGMRGVGMWTADFLDYSAPIPQQTKDMWAALRIALGKGRTREQQQQQDGLLARTNRV